eukprot:297235-Prymnesium_polylepis.1
MASCPRPVAAAARAHARPIRSRAHAQLPPGEPSAVVRLLAGKHLEEFRECLLQRAVDKLGSRPAARRAQAVEHRRARRAPAAPKAPRPDASAEPRARCAHHQEALDVLPTVDELDGFDARGVAG